MHKFATTSVITVLSKKNFSTSSSMCTAHYIGKFLNKIMYREKPKRATYRESIDTLLPELNLRKEGIPTHRSRRVTCLNKVFMKHITDLMATGEVAPQLVGKGIEISHVQVAPDFRCINIHWYSSIDNKVDGEVERTLSRAAGHLQFQLSTLQILGQVPPLNFVRNRQVDAIKEVERRLQLIDYGEGFEPTFGRNVNKEDIPSLETSLSKEIKAKLQEINSDDFQEEIIPKLPEMRNDVLGFNHGKIMDKVKTAVIKSKKVIEESEKLKSYPVPKGNEESCNEITSFLKASEESQVFNEFLKNRAIQEKKKKSLIPAAEFKRFEDEDEINYDEEEQVENNYEEKYDDFKDFEDYK